ncbi:hypothetical protein [Aureispira sp. CCB-QB1]|uniref:hypothetical protein n=1 Tax=Aureispira sp. CCB-QB1 TaxID=1313421 RepID=UPI0006967163|nr:hypothetical protein [Aureispira sp. CCB-QB1]
MVAAELRRMLEQFIDKRTVRAFLIEGKVIEIDKENKVCDVLPLDSQAPFQDVRLLPLSGSGGFGFTLYPKKDTNVTILKKTDTEAFLISCQEIESMELFVGDQFKLEVKNNGDCIFNDGSNGGLIIVDKLQQQVAKNSQLLQKIMTVFSTPVNEAGNGAPSVFQQALNAATQGSQTADLSNITNDKIKH